MVDFVISLVMGGTFLLVGATLTVVLQPRAARVWFLATGLLLAVAAVSAVAVVGGVRLPRVFNLTNRHRSTLAARHTHEQDLAVVGIPSA